jgi:hypothetical protein
MTLQRRNLIIFIALKMIITSHKTAGHPNLSAENVVNFTEPLLTKFPLTPGITTQESAANTPGAAVPSDTVETTAFPASITIGTNLFGSNVENPYMDLYLINTFNRMSIQHAKVDNSNVFPGRFSPNVTKIAFRTDVDGNRDIYKINSDGSGRVNLTNYPLDEPMPYWMPFVTQ